MRPDPSGTTGSPRATSSEVLHQAVARRAAAHPDAVALTSRRGTTSYGRLDRRSDAWAARLSAAGASSGDIVPVVLPRSVDLVTALLALLKTGAAYALLDPAWPVSYLREVNAELGAALVVTESSAGDDLGVPSWSPPAGEVDVPSGFRPAAADSSDPCCVFFTSGTTGRPKGVLSPHRATARLFRAGGFARFGPGTVMPLAARTPWDAFSLELWSMLLTGGTSVIVEDPFLSPFSLRTAVAQHGANTVWLTSSLFNMIVDEDLGAFGGMRQVFVGGERLSVSHVRHFLRAYPEIVLLNGYGPVESTIFATAHPVTEHDCERPGGIPLGRPVPGTRVHVLDEDRPCGPGELGEICISGDGLGLGYVGESTRSDEKFTSLMLDGRRIDVYRTGDLGVQDEDRLLHFRGRADRQLKVRGHRVDPAEVEHRLEKLLPAIRSCRVLARTDEVGAASELVAFCLPVNPADPLDDALPRLRARLMPHHCPAVVVSVERFPVTAQGKLDEQALWGMVADPAAVVGAVPAEPGDAILDLVAETFCAVLGWESVPFDVSFTELGGGSLDFGRVCARIAARTGHPVSPALLHGHSTVCSLAEWLRTRTEPIDRSTSAEVTGGDVPLNPMQLVHLSRSLADGSDRTSHCLLAWIVEGELDRDALEDAIAAVHSRHESLRAAYAAEPRLAARVVDIPPPPLDVLPAQPSVEAAELSLRDELGGALELAEGEVWRTVLVPFQDGTGALFGCVVHHIAFDGWSESVLADDLAAAYNAAPEGATAPPPGLAEVHRLRHAVLAEVDGEACRERLLAQLHDTPALRWPTAPVGGALDPPGIVEVRLGQDVVAALDASAAESGTTRFVLLLAHYARSLAAVTGQRDFAVGVPVAQRSVPGLERSIGCHINMVCLRLREAELRGDAAATAATAQVVEGALAAQEVSFAEVLDQVDPPRTGRPPIFQTLFALQDNEIPRLDLAGVRTTFRRQRYLDLPLELHAELWPAPDGGMLLTVYFRPDAVPRGVAEDIGARFAELVHPTASGDRA